MHPPGLTPPQTHFTVVPILTWRRVVVEPERDPRDADDHEGGDVDGHDVVGELPLQRHLHAQAAVVAGRRLHVAVVLVGPGVEEMEFINARGC